LNARFVVPTLGAPFVPKAEHCERPDFDKTWKWDDVGLDTLNRLIKSMENVIMTPRQNTKSKLPNYGLSLLTAGVAHFSVIASTHAEDKQSDDLRMGGLKGMGTSILRGSATLMLAIVLVLGCPGLVRAKNIDSELRVATFILPPFVIKKGDQLTGFSIELWDEIAARMKVKSRYQVVTDVNSCIESVRVNNADIGVSGIFYTVERDQAIDYTYSIVNAGIQVMVRDSGSKAHLHPLQDWLTLLFSQAAGLWLLAALLIALIPAHIVWLLDRTNKDGVSPTENYFPGIFHSLFWAMTAVASQAPVMPKQWMARTFAVIWIFAGVVFVSLFTAQLAALLTVAQIQGTINGPGDLPGQRVGTLVASTSAIYLRNIEADVQEFQSTDEMYQALLDGKVDAVVLGSPVLSYYAAHEGRGRVKLVGPEIDKNDIGFVLPLGSHLRKQISNELLALREDGTYQRIYAKWFGNE